MSDIGHHCSELFTASARNSGLVVLLAEAIGEPKKTTVALSGYAKCGKSALVKRGVLHHFCGPDHSLIDGWLNLPWQNKEYHDIPLHSIDVVHDRDDASNVSRNYLEYTEFLDELIRELLPGDQEEVLSEIKDGAKNARHRFLADALYANKRPNKRTVLLLQGTVSDRSFRDQVEEALHNALTVWRAGHSAEPRPLQPLVIYEVWPSRSPTSTPKSAGVVPAAPGGRPPTSKPNPMLGLTRTASASESTGKDDHAVWGLGREEVLALAAQVLSAALRGLATDGSDAVYRNVGEKVYAYSGGHLGLIVLLIQAIVKEAKTDPAIKSQLRTTDEAALDSAIKTCIARTPDFDLESSVKHIWDSTGLSSLPSDQDSLLLGKLREAGLMIADSEEKPKLGKLLSIVTNLKFPNNSEGGLTTVETEVIANLSMLTPALIVLADWLRPGAHAFTTQVGNAFGTVMANTIYRRFKERVDENPVSEPGTAVTPMVMTIARTTLEQFGNEERREFLKEIKRAAVALLLDPYLFNRIDLQRLWLNHGNPDEPFNDMWIRVGSTQPAAADEIAAEAIRQGRLEGLLKDVQSKARPE